MSKDRFAIVADKHEIETLQRLYAKATDLIGCGTTESFNEGREIYRSIYTNDVEIRTANTDDEPFVAKGPDAWADVCRGALKDYTGTQHLIGTQLTAVNGDEAQMESYLNAWHKNPDLTVYYFLGTYISKARRLPEGWRIYDMTLRLDTSGTVQTS
ncbi:MAG: nuclear transport factor 2 family protein [Gammaproteobacteria bacterium]|nr:nuclear transport factor 2 family protein [Gammaproteobacteria bacterium]